MTLAQRCGLDGAERQRAAHALLERLDAGAITQVRIAWADLHGALRAKTLIGREALAAAFDDGVGLVSTLLLKDTADRTAFKVFERGGLDAAAGLAVLATANNVQLLPDPSSWIELPHASGTAWLRGEPFLADGTPAPADPRRVLQQALARLAAFEGRGLGLRCGLEVEFHVWRIAGDGPGSEAAAWPADPSALHLLHPGYQLLSEGHADMADDALAIVRRTALGLGLPLRSLEIELGPSQFEAVFAPTDALTAADHLVLFRNHVRQALRRAGYHASFVCRPPDPPCAAAIASGWHLHQSLALAPGGVGAAASVMAGDGEGGLSPLGRAWLGGLLAHAAGMTALCAPTLPAYARYHGSVMAPCAAVWGRDNRGAMLRVVGEGAATRIENRIGEPMANPYLAIAAQVLAGFDGLQRALEPGPPCETPYAAGLAQLPASLGDALDALAADRVLGDGLGAAMAAVFHTVKRHEIARHAAAADPAQWERREYLARF
jgi:glutamine synthetase